MKRILTILGAISLVTTTTTTVVSCGNKTKAEVDKLKNQLKELQKQKDHLLDEHSQELQQKQQELKELQNELTTKQLEITKLNEQISQKDTQIADFETRLGELTMTLAEKETLLQQKEQEHQDLSEQHQQVKSELESLQTAYQNKISEAKIYQAKIADLESQIESQAALIEQKTSAIESLVKQNKLDEARVETLTELLQAAKLKNRQLETQITNLNDQLDKNVKSSDELKNLLKTLTSEKHQLESQLSESQEKVKSFEMELQNRVWTDLDDLLEHYNRAVNLEQKVLEIQTELEAKNKALIEKNQQLQEKVTENQTLRDTILDLEQQNDQIMADFEKARNDLEKLNQTVAQKTAELVDLKAKNQQLIKSKAKLEADLKTSQEQNQQLTSLKRQLEQDLKTTTASLEKKNLEITSLKTEKETLNSQVTTLKAQLADANIQKSALEQEIETLKQQKQAFESRYNSLSKEYEELSKSYGLKKIVRKEVDPAFWSLLDTKQSDLKIRQDIGDYSREEDKHTPKNFYMADHQSKAQLKKQEFYYKGIREFLLEFIGKNNLKEDSKYLLKVDKKDYHKYEIHPSMIYDDIYLSDLANPNNLKLIQTQMQLWLNSLKTNTNYHRNYFGLAKYWINLLNPVVKVFHLTKKDSNVRNLTNYDLEDNKEYLDAKSTRIEISLQPQIKATDSPEDKLIKKLVYGDKRFFDLAMIDFTDDWNQNGMYARNEDGPWNLSFNDKALNRSLYESGYYGSKYSIRIKKIEEALKKRMKGDDLNLDVNEATDWFFSIKLNEY
ncbi:lipoprotein [Mesoplasma seiffertii]|uniref:lipoprotein n=1 Tax=Mesoplasma seiffertii TaxID=28224 RepID=UPI0004795713|nr:lipoprotein [Mesoplasma seiffertii]